MWFIEGQVTRRGRQTHVRTWLKPGHTLTLGRQDNDPDVLCVGTDVNVSRRHVALTVGESTLADVTTRTAPTTLIIRDLSQNGVFLDGVRISRQVDTPVRLTKTMPRRLGAWSSLRTNTQSQIEAEDHEMRSAVAGSGYSGSVDMIIGNMTFRLERVDFSLAFAGMSSSDKIEVSQLAADMGLKVEPKEWVTGVSTHLVMSSSSSPRAEQFRLSEKVYQALAQGGHIVTMLWLKALRDALEASTKNRYEVFDPIPESSYLPSDLKSLAQVSGILWSPNFKRKSLFDHLHFVFLSHDTKASKWEACIQSAGGTVAKEEPSNATAVIRRCLMQDKKEPVFLRPTSEESFAKISSSVEPVLKKMGYRWVETREIGMAILAISVEQFCNPKYKGQLPTLDDQLTNATMSTYSTLDPQHSSTMQPLPEEAPSLPTGGGRQKGLHRDETVLKDEDQALLPSLDFDDLMMPRRGKGLRTSSVTPTTTVTRQSATPTPVRPPTQATATPVSPTPTSSTRDTVKKRRRLDMFIDEDDDVIVMDTAPQALKTPTPVSNQQQRLPTASEPTKTADSNQPIMLDSDDDFDLGLPPKRSRTKRDGTGNDHNGSDGSGKTSTKGSPLLVAPPSKTDRTMAASQTHEKGVDRLPIPAAPAVGDPTDDYDNDKEAKGEKAKPAIVSDPLGVKRRKILMSDSDSQPTKSADMFDDLEDAAVVSEEKEEKPLKPTGSSSSMMKKSRPTETSKGASATSTATSRRKLDPVHQDISLYHIEDMIHHQSEIQKYERQEAELEQRREMERLEKEYERSTSMRPDAAGGTEADQPIRKQHTALMTSVYSDRLLDKGKRRKILMKDGIKKEGESEASAIALGDAAPSTTSSLSLHQQVSGMGEQISTLSLQARQTSGEGGGDQDHPEWPERWKKMPNFKTRPPVDPVLVEKWKGRPNFKAFRRNIMPGIPMTNRPSVPLSVPGQ